MEGLDQNKSHDWAEGAKGTDFKAYINLTLNRKLSIDEMSFYAPVYNCYSQLTVQKAIDLYLDQNKNNKFIKLPRPRELKELCEQVETQNAIDEIGTSDCRLCNNTGERFLMWAGNTPEKHDWRTNKNPEGMRIVKERGKWNYVKYSICPCKCSHGYKKWRKGNKAQSFEAIKKLEAGGWLIKHNEFLGTYDKVGASSE